jgi:hypothetical protein
MSLSEKNELVMENCSFDNQRQKWSWKKTIKQY